MPMYACKTFIKVFEVPRQGNGKQKEVLAVEVLAEHYQLLNIVKHTDGIEYPRRAKDAVAQRFKRTG